jgi:hypothetical protein
MRRPLLIAALGLALSGCGLSKFGAKGDPDWDALAPGSRAVAAIPSGTDRAPAEALPYLETGDGARVRLDPGTPVRVVADPGGYVETAADVAARARHYASWRDNPAAVRWAAEEARSAARRFDPPHPTSERRRVRVTVEAGPHAGAVGSILRAALRPTK